MVARKRAMGAKEAWDTARRLIYRAYADARLKREARGVYTVLVLEIVAFGNIEDAVYVDRVCKCAGYDVSPNAQRYVRRALSKLEECGYIKRRKRRLASVITMVVDGLLDRSGETGLDRSGETGLDRSGETGLDRSGETGLDRSGETGLDRSGETGPKQDRSGETALDRSGETGLKPDRSGETARPVFGDRETGLGRPPNGSSPGSSSGNGRSTAVTGATRPLADKPPGNYLGPISREASNRWSILAALIRERWSDSVAKRMLSWALTHAGGAWREAPVDVLWHVLACGLHVREQQRIGKPVDEPERLWIWCGSNRDQARIADDHEREAKQRWHDYERRHVPEPPAWLAEVVSGVGHHVGGAP